jgi:hypothetical protein
MVSTNDIRLLLPKCAANALEALLAQRQRMAMAAHQQNRFPAIHWARARE